MPSSFEQDPLSGSGYFIIKGSYGHLTDEELISLVCQDYKGWVGKALIQTLLDRHRN